MFTSRRAVNILAFWGLWTSAVAIAAAAPAPVITSAPSLALKQGETIDVTVSGHALASVESAPMPLARGVRVEIVKADKPQPTELHLKIIAGPNAALGDREFRLLGPNGVTRPLHVFVSQYPITAEKEPNNAPNESQEVSFPATILGRIEPAGDVDQFRFHAIKGQQLIFDVHAARMNSPLDPVATIHASDGREMHVTIEHHDGDPVLIFQAPDDGDYRLRLRDLEYRGGETYEYRVVAGQIPYLETVLPSSGEPGQVITAQAIGYNLDGGEKFTVDLSNSPPGRIEVRTKAAGGISNPVPFEVTELPQAVESEPNDTAETANPVAIPAEVSAHIDHSGDTDFFKFHVAYKQLLSLEVLAGRYGSPVAPLLQLRNIKGDVIVSNDGTADSDARIVRDLDAGDYIASVTDLTYAGGPGYWYRLKIEPASHVPQDFSIHILPDAPHLHRGGNVAMWCEIKRFNGFKGDISFTGEGLPAGVTIGPIMTTPDASGWFTLSASPDAALGTVPLRIRASTTIGPMTTSHLAEPEVDGRVVQEAYLTVDEAAPFKVDAVAAMTPDQVAQMSAEIRQLAIKVNEPDPNFDSEMAEWEKKAAVAPVWTVLEAGKAESAGGVELARQPDGSLLASGKLPAQDVYTITAHTNLKKITGVRLEAMTDERLPNRGPGASAGGNFVLTGFRMLAAREGQSPQPVMFSKASADFSQGRFPVSDAIDNNPTTGWAINPQEGREHVAVFQTATPVGFDDGTTLTFVLEHQSKFPKFLLGRFRIAVTTSDPELLNKSAELPREVATILAEPSDQRTADQKNELANYFRTVNPKTAVDRGRMDSLRSFVEPYAELDRLQNLLASDSDQLKTEEEEWAKQMAGGAAWSVLRVSEAQSTGGTSLQREADGSVFAEGITPANDTYELSAATTLKQITAIRLEVLSDPRLPNNGPGRAGDGNFILTKFAVFKARKGGASTQPVEFESARASVQQEKYPIEGTLDDKDETGWAISPHVGRPVEATFYPKEPIPGGMLTIRLEQHAKLPQYTLGRVRLWVTGNPQPDAAPRVPEKIATLLRSKARSPEQERELTAYFRTIAPSLEPIRQRIADLRTEIPAIPFTVERRRNGAIPVPIRRTGDFAGEIQVTLEGFADGREGNLPAPITKELKLDPLTIGPDQLFGMLTFEPQRREEVGTRMVVLKAQAKVGNEMVTEYSPAFPLTIGK